jgi:hypothetical protein
LDHADTVAAPDGKTQITVAYASDKNITDLVTLYSDSLRKAGWNVKVQTLNPSLGIISTTKATDNIIITFAPVTDKSTMVTFQYSK